MIISNSTPLIAFARIGRLALLKEIVGNLVIPSAVEHELSEYGCGKTGSVDLSKESWIAVRSVKSKNSVRPDTCKRKRKNKQNQALFGRNDAPGHSLQPTIY